MNRPIPLLVNAHAGAWQSYAGADQLSRMADDVGVVIIGDLTRKELLPHYRAVRAQSHPSLAKVRVLKAAMIRVEIRRPMHVHADDQDVGVTPVDIAPHPRALSVLVNRL